VVAEAAEARGGDAELAAEEANQLLPLKAG
jgi:hypothetical protein